MKLFARITKVDLEKREVWGRAVQEVPDKVKEIFDYETSVPHFKGWSASFEKATESLPEPSLGNIRAMHGKVAAGKVIAIDFADTDKAIDIGTKIVDDNEWEKCAAGVYTGFSIGGSYVKKWKDGEDPTLTRYTANPSEISLVDNPCVPTAMFSVVKAEGATEEHAFQRYGLLKAALERTDMKIGELLFLAKEYLPEDQLDTLVKSDNAIVDMQDQLRALLADEAKQLEKKDETPATETQVAASVVPAATSEQAAPIDAAATEGQPAEKLLTHLRKGMYSVQTFAGILQSLAWLAQDVESEKTWENDASAVPAQLRTALQLLCQIFKTMSAEETDEMIASLVPDGVVIEVIELAASGDLGKAGKRHSKGDMNMIQSMHDNSVSLGADCSASKSAGSTGLAKAELDGALAKLATLEKALADVTTDRNRLAALPLPPKGVMRVVDKTNDEVPVPGATKSNEPVKPNPTNPLAVMKQVHEQGGTRIIV